MKSIPILAGLVGLSFFVACGGGDDPGGDGDGDLPGDGDGDASGGSGGDGDGLGGEGGDGDGPLTLVDAPQDAECNLSGVWAVITKTRTTASSMAQVANRWFLYEISHDGDTVTVERSTNCHVRVQNDGGISSVLVTVSDDALRTIISTNSHAGLSGTYTSSGDGCDLDLDRVYFVLGADATLFLPEDPSTRPELADLPPLPTEDDTTGAEDWDGDGKPGLAFEVDAFVSGTRNSVQRAYQEFESDAESPDYTIEHSATSFTVNNLTDISESILSADNALLESVGSLRGSDHPVTFTRLGGSRETAEFPSGEAVPSDDFDACKALEEEFPFSL